MQESACMDEGTQLFWMSLQPSLLLCSYQQEKSTGLFATSGVCSIKATGITVGAALQWLQFKVLCAVLWLLLGRPHHLPAVWQICTGVSNLLFSRVLEILNLFEPWMPTFPFYMHVPKHILSIQSTAATITLPVENSNHVISSFKTPKQEIT